MKLLTTEEAAELLKMHNETIRKMCRSDKLPCIKIGRHWKIKEDELFKWIDEQQKKGG